MDSSRTLWQTSRLRALLKKDLRIWKTTSCRNYTQDAWKGLSILSKMPKTLKSSSWCFQIIWKSCLSKLLNLLKSSNFSKKISSCYSSIWLEIQKRRQKQANNQKPIQATKSRKKMLSVWSLDWKCLRMLCVTRWSKIRQDCHFLHLFSNVTLYFQSMNPSCSAKTIKSRSRALLRH